MTEDTPALCPESHQESPRFLYIERAGWVALGTGLALAFVPFFMPRIRWILSYFATLVHEIGHSAAAWVFGYPSIPAFDFRYGGGVAVTELEASTWVLVVLGIAFLAFLANNYRDRAILTLSLLGLACYLVLRITSLHRLLILYLGHGTELLFAVLFIYRAASNWAVHHGVERLLYAVIGFYLAFANVAFCRSLLIDEGYRAIYFDGKAEGMPNDFYRIWVVHAGAASFERVVVVHLVLTLLCPLAALLLHYLISRNTQDRA
ncbi:MAG: hypothetical protein HN742_21650 [Lentisphaerae bacterium]|nr:hypothetical protein [Lentisphaerota bacterium]MBT4819065.1 hypothetical protein [Lentisphaerota bacterium]MBT5608340.1 hypothetical protein [Lentisphaerota bacterium]MBT7057465.1 hypothetical protein [Lentisphaerota bacterium]MBT7844497.1 hypothetical protein [Lentisphaerota bacterium]